MRTTRLTLLPLLAALLPAVGIHVSYLLSAAEGQIPWCFVYLEGCTSISSTGRQPPGSFVFRGTIIPTAALLILYWQLCRRWLRALGSAYHGIALVMATAGTVGAVALIVYATALGSIGPAYAVQRRIGVSLFYLLTFASQVLLTWQLAQVRRSRPAAIGPATLRALHLLVALTLAGAAASIALGLLDPGYHSYDDAFEWSLTLLMLGHVFVTGLAWRDSGFAVGFAIDGGRSP